MEYGTVQYSRMWMVKIRTVECEMWIESVECGSSSVCIIFYGLWIVTL